MIIHMYINTPTTYDIDIELVEFKGQLAVYGVTQACTQ